MQLECKYIILRDTFQPFSIVSYIMIDISFLGFLLDNNHNVELFPLCKVFSANTAPAFMRVSLKLSLHFSSIHLFNRFFHTPFDGNDPVSTNALRNVCSN